MDDYVVRGIYIIFTLGAGAVLFARGVAYWLQWQPWTVRGVGLCALAVGIFGVFDAFGAGNGLKALLAVAIGGAIYIWQDLICERKEEEVERQR